MGAWGIALFQSDNDLDIVGDLDVAANLEVVKKKLLANKENYALQKSWGDDDDENIPQKDRRPWEYGLSLHKPKYPDLIRDHLDSGALLRVIAKYRNGSNAYVLIILAACAMQLGCKLPAFFLEEIAVDYQRSHLMPEASGQIKDALRPYRDGVPYDFQSKGLNDTVASGSSSHNNAGINYQDLEDVPEGEEIAADTVIERIPYDFNFPATMCGNCGAKKCPNGTKLKRCKGCKARLYCSRDCQKWHFGSHYRVCKGAETVSGRRGGTGEGDENVEKEGNQEDAKESMGEDMKEVEKVMGESTKEAKRADTKEVREAKEDIKERAGAKGHTGKHASKAENDEEEGDSGLGALKPGFLLNKFW